MAMQETAPVSGIEEALAQCGVTETTLDPAQKEALDRLGYLVLPAAIDRDWLARLRATVDAALDRGERHGQHVRLDWADPVFDGVYTHPRVLAAVYQVLRRSFKAGGVTARAPAPGQGLQGLHADFPRAPSDPFQVVTALWLLDDFTPSNGATRVIPGSHRMAKALPKAMQQPESRHPDQKLVLAEAGSVLVFNGHLWHGGTRNESDRPRRALQGQYRARELVYPGDTPPDLPARLLAAARYLLGEGGRD
jgi:ectoine hydroxylase-related dioxygenase (phytanoyl-CoA dioxygenase family)